MSILSSAAIRIAPWAAVVPGYGPVTVDLLLTLPDDGYCYEVVEGVLVRMAGSGFEATTIGGAIFGALWSFVRPRRLGIVTPADGVYKFPGAETGLIPDVGIFRAERRALIADRRKPIPFAPDLAVEVAFPNQQADELAQKARLYLANGARLVWVAWLASGHIDIWHADHPGGPVATLTASDTLLGEDVIPGFACPVLDVFGDPLS